MWKNYFFQIQKKYSMRVSTKQPLIIRFDGKNVTKNKNIDLLGTYNNSFLDNLEKTVKYFTQKYNCFSIFGSDEVSFILANPMLLIEDLDSDKTNHSNEIISLFSQYFFDYFNNFDKNKKIYWHGKCFSIPENKIQSYIKYRSGIIKNVMITYFLKTKGINLGNIKLIEKENKSKQFSDYTILEEIQNGILYYDGYKIDFEELIKGNIKKVESKKNNDLYIDLLDFN